MSLLGGRWDDGVRTAIEAAAAKALARAMENRDTPIALLPGHLRSTLRLDSAADRYVIERPRDWAYNAPLIQEDPWPPAMITVDSLAQDYLYRELACLPDPQIDAALEALGPLATGKWQFIGGGWSSLDPALPGYRRFYSTNPRFSISIAYPAEEACMVQLDTRQYDLQIFRGDQPSFWVIHREGNADSMAETWLRAQDATIRYLERRSDRFIPVGPPDGPDHRAFRAPFATWRGWDGDEGMAVYFQSQRPGWCWFIEWRSGKYGRDIFDVLLGSFRWMRPVDIENLPRPH